MFMKNKKNLLDAAKPLKGLEGPDQIPKLEAPDGVAKLDAGEELVKLLVADIKKTATRNL
ncbi:hypothetical protein CVV38_01965 [Candidatus Peregrinibacteria bacterium HGW-Peregrinibacteria-1]|jgi:hypothetical protein|nr:MAG: hypothetical protein CVV38_01965 [Candidatus Peregrinibacteria bacterium HGW-Peregrinibacteria-1]